MRSAVFAVAFVLATLLAGCGGGSGPVYLALGDSFGVGVGASEEDEAGYVPLFYRFLKEELDDGLVLRNISVEGETSESLVREGQLARALEILQRNWDDDHANDIAVITLDIGGNDLRALIKEDGPCGPQPSLDDPACAGAVPQVIEEYATNLTAILQTIRVAAGPDVQILVLTLMNVYSGTGGPLDGAGDLVTAVINEQTKAAVESPAVRATLVDIAPAFVGHGPELSHVQDPDPDFHLNDAGYQLLAAALIEAYQR